MERQRKREWELELYPRVGVPFGGPYNEGVPLRLQNLCLCALCVLINGNLGDRNM